MKRMNRMRKNFIKIAVGILIGSLVGATLGWLTAPTSGAQMRRSLQEKVKTAGGNVESKARELAAGVNENANKVKQRITHRKEALPLD